MSSKPTSSEIVSLIFSNATQSLQIEIDFSTDKYRNFFLLDQKQNESSTTKETLDLLEENLSENITLINADFSGPLSLHFVIQGEAASCTCNQRKNQAVSLASVLLFPGSIEELENPNQLNRSFADYANYTKCLYSDKLSFAERKKKTKSHF